MQNIQMSVWQSISPRHIRWYNAICHDKDIDILSMQQSLIDSHPFTALLFTLWHLTSDVFVVSPLPLSFSLQTISHQLCLRNALFLPCRSAFGGQTRKRWCHDGYHLQCFSQLQMYRPPSLLRYDLSLGVQREHLLDDLVSRMQARSDARHYTGESFLVWCSGKYFWSVFIYYSYDWSLKIGQRNKQTKVHVSRPRTEVY